MDGQDGGDVGLVVFVHPLRAAHASPSLREGEEGVLVWPAGVLQVFMFGWGVCPLCPSDISPASGDNPSGFVSSPRLRGLDVGPSFNSSICPRCQAVGPEFGRLSCAVLHRSVSPELVL